MSAQALKRSKPGRIRARLGALGRGIGRRLNGFIDAAQLGPSRYEDAREFWPARPR